MLTQFDKIRVEFVKDIGANVENLGNKFVEFINGHHVGNIATLEKLSKDIRKFFGLEDDDEDVSVQPIMKQDTTKAVIKTYHYNIKDVYEF